MGPKVSETNNTSNVVSLGMKRASHLWTVVEWKGMKTELRFVICWFEEDLHTSIFSDFVFPFFLSSVSFSFFLNGE